MIVGAGDLIYLKESANVRYAANTVNLPVCVCLFCCASTKLHKRSKCFNNKSWASLNTEARLR